MGDPALACHEDMAPFSLPGFALDSSKSVFSWSRFLKRCVPAYQIHCFCAETTTLSDSDPGSSHSSSAPTSSDQTWFIFMRSFWQENLASYPRSIFHQTKVVPILPASLAIVFDLAQPPPTSQDHVAQTTMVRHMCCWCLRCRWSMWKFSFHPVSALGLAFNSHSRIFNA